jgi:AcrR family transcriptional regulator
MSGTARRAPGQHHGDLRHALEEAALQLVAERGPRGFSLAEVTRRAGVSVAAPYKHFADRDALLAALAERGYTEQHRRFGAAMAAAADPAGQLAAFAAEYVRFAVEQRALFEITFRSGLGKDRYPALSAAGDRVLGVLRGPAAQLRGSGAAGLDLIYAVAASAHGFAMFLLEGVFDGSDDPLAAAVTGAARSARILAADRPGEPG